MNKIAFDIETGPLPRSSIEHLKPKFTAPANYKDPEKINTNIAEQEAQWFKEAALSPITGRVLAIGFRSFGVEDVTTLEGDEGNILSSFWWIVEEQAFDSKWYGWGIAHFDAPYLIKRSWANNVKVPMALVMNGRYLSDRRFLDLMVAFQCGNTRDPYMGLDRAARFFGLQGKTEDIGATFSEVYAKDRPRALSYLKREVEVVENIAGRMGV